MDYVLLQAEKDAQELLEAEGVIFSASGKCDLGTFQWFPEGFGNEDDDQISLFTQ